MVYNLNMPLFCHSGVHMTNTEKKLKTSIHIFPITASPLLGAVEVAGPVAALIHPGWVASLHTKQQPSIHTCLEDGAFKQELWVYSNGFGSYTAACRWVMKWSVVLRKRVIQLFCGAKTDAASLEIKTYTLIFRSFSTVSIPEPHFVSLYCNSHIAPPSCHISPLSPLLSS